MGGGRRKLFDWWARRYNESVAASDHPFPFEGYDRVLDAIVKEADAKPGMSVLDVGIGTGNLAGRFAELGCTVWGLDFSPEMLARARKRAPGVRLVQADLLDEWPGELRRAFDRIVSAYVLHEFDLAAKMRLLQRIASEHLAAGGRIVIGDIAFPTIGARAGAQARWAERWDEEEHYWAAEEAIPAGARVGLRVSYRQISSCGGCSPSSLQGYDGQGSRTAGTASWRPSKGRRRRTPAAEGRAADGTGAMVSQTLRGRGVTLQRSGSATGPAVDANWLVEVAGAGIVGELGSRPLVPRARRAGIEVKAWCVGERAQLATALRLLADHLFERFGLHRLDLDLDDREMDAIAAALQCGFVEEGRHRQVKIADGYWRDRVQLGLLEDEWRRGTPTSRRQFAPSAPAEVGGWLGPVPSPTAKEFAVLRGRMITMRRKRPSDKELFYRWLRRPEWWRLWMPEDPDGFSPAGREQFEAAWNEEPSPEQWIVETERGAPLGVCFYSGLDKANRAAEAGSVLYEAELRGRGYGTDALGVLLRHLFGDLKLHRVNCGTWSGNIGSLRVQQKNGLEVEVRKRDAFFVDGEWYDGLGTGILEDEFGTQR